MDNNRTTNYQGYSSNKKKGKDKSSKTGIAIVIFVLIIIAAIVAIVVIPKMMPSVDEYLAEGDYEKAYDKASNQSEKFDVAFENVVAAQCEYATKKMGSPSDFALVGAYIDTLDIKDNSTGEILSFYYLVIGEKSSEFSGNDSEGYLLFGLDSKTGEWKDEINDKSSQYKYDIETSQALISDLVKNSKKLSQDGVDRINKLYKDGKLSDVKRLDYEFK